MEQYEASIAAVHPAGGLPAGQMFHSAGPSADGWTIVAIHDSRESWEDFRDNILMPRMQQGITAASWCHPSRQPSRFTISSPRRRRAAGGSALYHSRRPNLLSHSTSDVRPLKRHPPQRVSLRGNPAPA